MSKSFVVVPVRSVDDSLDFYQGILDFKLKKRVNPAPYVDIAWVENGDGFVVELLHRDDMPRRENSDSLVTLSFQVDDMMEKEELLKREGIPFETMDLPGGIRINRFKDPDGTPLSFMS